MGKKHASQYANFGWLHRKVLFPVVYLAFQELQNLKLCRYLSLKNHLCILI